MSRKEDSLRSRPLLFASRSTCAAAFEICTATWDAWVKDGTMPKPYNLGESGGTVRWLWEDVLEACEALRAKTKTGGRNFSMDLTVLRRQHESQGKTPEGRG